MIDSLSGLERIATPRALVDFVTALGGLLRQREVTTLLTTTPAPSSQPQTIPATVIEATSLNDITIRLHYFEAAGRNQRAISVLQTRGSAHDENIRRVSIDHTGLHIGDPLPATGDRNGDQSSHHHPQRRAPDD